MRERDGLRNALMATGWTSATLIKKYKKARKEAKKASKVSRACYEEDLAKDNNKKRLFAYANAQRSCRVPIAALLNSSGEVVTDGSAMADVLNKQFQSVFVVEDDTQLPEFGQRDYIAPLEACEITEDEIKYLLERLDKSKSRGEDDVSPFVLCKCAAALAKPLARLFN